MSFHAQKKSCSFFSVFYTVWPKSNVQNSLSNSCSKFYGQCDKFYRIETKINLLAFIIYGRRHGCHGHCKCVRIEILSRIYQCTIATITLSKTYHIPMLTREIAILIVVILWVNKNRTAISC